MYIVYKLTAPSGKLYIGWTGQSLKNRIAGHHNYAFNSSKGRKSKMISAIKKYPLEQWDREILFESDNKELTLRKEQQFIKIFNSIEDGYNTSIGGESGSSGCHFERSQQHQQKLANSRSRNWKITTPTNETLVIKNLTNFCRENDLNHSAMIGVANGTRNQHKQYKCYREAA
jgi:hypothetical protein